MLVIGFIYRFYPENMSMLPDYNIEFKTRQLEKYKQLINKRDALEEKKSVLSRLIGRAEAALLTGNTPALAAVDIQNALNEIAAATNVNLNTVRVIRSQFPEDDTYLSPISVQITIETTIRQLKEIIYRIENANKMLKLDKLSVKLKNSKQNIYLISTMTIVGYMR